MNLNFHALVVIDMTWRLFTLPHCYLITHFAWRWVFSPPYLRLDDSEAMWATVGFAAWPLVITTPGVLRNVGLSCSPLLPPSSASVSLCVPSPRRNRAIPSLFFFFFAFSPHKPHSSIFHSGAHIPFQIAGLLDAEALRTVARYLFLY